VSERKERERKRERSFIDIQEVTERENEIKEPFFGPNLALQRAVTRCNMCK
jgi:hypothetical protein